MSEQTRRWLGFAATVCGAAAASGALLGWLSRSAGWGFGGLAAVVGLAVGAAVIAFRWPSRREQIAAGAIGLALGLGFFAWISSEPAWQAESAVADGELDDLCVRVTALRLCGERTVMGVFDFNDVPASIRRQARQHVERMTRSEKLSLCDGAFGRVVNNSGPVQAGWSGTTLPSLLWLVAAIAGSALPAAIRQRFRHSDMHD